jgi:hypothetical protein
VWLLDDEPQQAALHLREDRRAVPSRRPAAQDGARTAAVGGANAGVARADAILRAAGAAGASLHASARVDVDEVTVRVTGSAPRLFPLSLVLPNVVANASLPLERYPQAEAGP